MYASPKQTECFSKYFNYIYTYEAFTTNKEKDFINHFQSYFKIHFSDGNFCCFFNIVPAYVLPILYIRVLVKTNNNKFKRIGEILGFEKAELMEINIHTNLNISYNCSILEVRNIFLKLY